MNRKIWTTGVLLLLFILSVCGMADAQDKIPLEFGQWVSGEITGDQYETKYTFSGKTGQLVMGVMMADPDDSSLDAFLILRNSDGDVLGQNDDVLDGASLVVAKLPADGDYTLVATRYDGKNGDSEGKYEVRVDTVEPLTAGTKMTVSVNSPEEKRYPSFFMVAPESNESTRFVFSVPAGSRYPQLALFKWVDDNYPDIVLWAEYTNYVSNLAFNAELEADNFYVLMVDPIPVFYGNDEDNTTLTFSVG
jgi:hypothetical protein